jgi:hypothetical protein
MAVAATIKYFGRQPTTIVMQSSNAFDGTAQTGTPTISPGLYLFPVQAGGGLYNLHEETIEIKQVTFDGGGTLTVTKVVGNPASPTTSTVVATLASNGQNLMANTTNIYLTPGEALKFTGGSSNPKVCITASLADHSSDGAA